MHGHDVLHILAVLEVWNGHFSEVDCQKTLDGVPVLDVTLSLGDALKDSSLVLGLVVGGFEHAFESEFTLTKLLDELSVFAQLLDCLLLADIASLFLGDGVD